MAYRITDSMLQARVNRLNAITKSPTEYRTDGVISVGHYTLSGAYGGVSLHRIVNTSGGVSDVFSCGHVTKRDLFDRINAYLLGLETGKGE